MEILVIDDHSTDCSVEVVDNLIEKHPERVFRHIVNPENLGLSMVRNIAIKEARGEFLFFIDGDDTIESGTLTLFYSRIEETDVDVVCGSFRKKDFDGNTYIIKQFPEDTIKGDFAYASYIERYINGFFSIVVWNKLYSLNFLRKNNICCAPHYREFESSFFTFKVALYAQSISFIHDITYNYYDIPTSICHQRNDLKYLYNYRAVIESVIDVKNDFELFHKVSVIPCGILFLFNYICLTSGLLKRAVVSDVNKREKILLLKWLKEQYVKNDMNWSNIVGPYNKISYLILISPFPYFLFRFYYKHLRIFATIIGLFSRILNN